MWDVHPYYTMLVRVLPLMLVRVLPLMLVRVLTLMLVPVGSLSSVISHRLTGGMGTQTHWTDSSSFSDLFLFLFQRGTTTFNVMLAQVNHMTFFSNTSVLPAADGEIKHFAL